MGVVPSFKVLDGFVGQSLCYDVPRDPFSIYANHSAGFGVNNGGRSLVVVVPCVQFCRRRAVFLCAIFVLCRGTLCFSVSGTFELAGGGVGSTDAELSLGAFGAGAGGFTWEFCDILSSAFKQEKFWQENSAGKF